MASQSVFESVEKAPPDLIFNVLAKFKEDPDQNKVNLSVGGEKTRKVALNKEAICVHLLYTRFFYVHTAYRTEEGLPWVLPVVRTVEAQMGTDAMLNHEYLPLDGLKAFTEASSRLILGSDSPAITQNRVLHQILPCSSQN